MGNIKEYKTEDKNRIFELLSRTYNPQLVKIYESIWEWLFTNNPFLPGDSGCVSIMEEGNDLAGVVCSIFADVKLNNCIRKCRWASFFIIDQRYRGSGIELATSVMNSKYHPMFGFPNPKASVFEKNLGFRHIGNIKSRIRIFNISSFFRRIRIDVPILSKTADISTASDKELDYDDNGLNIRRIFDFDDTFDDFWEMAASGYDYIVVRSRSYLHWRFVDSPIKYMIYKAIGKDNSLKGYIVLRILKNKIMTKGYIVDIFARQDDFKSINSLVKFSVCLFKKEKCDLAECLISTSRSAYNRALYLNGFIINRPKVEFLFFSGLESDMSQISVLGKWFITAADPDLEMTNIFPGS
ncbi:MAG: hypothetical protein C4533_06410 [Candidatus Omnitrophota bacterium]|nr:MAG: hypothetical protein C4533_06410 [Candidatus Omnitrophota bacterium]